MLLCMTVLIILLIIRGLVIGNVLCIYLFKKKLKLQSTELAIL